MSKNKKNCLVTFWLFNAINILCAIAVVATTFYHFAEQSPSEASHIMLFAIMQAFMAFVINLLFYKVVGGEQNDQ